MKVKLLAIAYLTAIFLSACGTSAPASATPDVFAIHTFAAQTVVAELTQTAAANSPTPEATTTEIEAPSTATTVPTSVETATPIPTETPTITPTIFVEASPTDQFAIMPPGLPTSAFKTGPRCRQGKTLKKPGSSKIQERARGERITKLVMVTPKI